MYCNDCKKWWEDCECDDAAQGSKVPAEGDKNALLNADPLQEIANKVCAHVPLRMTVQLCMENGCAYVELVDHYDNRVDLPDSADKTLQEQLNDALCVANGWGI